MKTRMEREDNELGMAMHLECMVWDIACMIVEQTGQDLYDVVAHVREVGESFSRSTEA